VGVSTMSIYGTLFLLTAVAIVPIGFAVFGWFLYREKEHKIIRVALIALSLLFLPCVSAYYWCGGYREEFPQLTHHKFVEYYNCSGVPLAEEVAYYVLFAWSYCFGLIFLWWVPVAVIDLLYCGVEGGHIRRRTSRVLLWIGVLNGAIVGGAYCHLLIYHPRYTIYLSQLYHCSPEVITRIVGGVLASLCCACWCFAARGLSLIRRGILVSALIGVSWLWVEWLGHPRWAFF
jgi:hypothetical protein